MVKLTSGPLRSGDEMVVDIDKCLRECSVLIDVLGQQEKAEKSDDQQGQTKQGFRLTQVPELQSSLPDYLRALRRNQAQAEQILAQSALTLYQFLSVGRFVVGRQRLPMDQRLRPDPPERRKKRLKAIRGGQCRWEKREIDMGDLERELALYMEASELAEAELKGLIQESRDNLNGLQLEIEQKEKKIAETETHLDRIVNFSDNKRWVQQHMLKGSGEIGEQLEHLQKFKKEERGKLRAEVKGLEADMREEQQYLELAQLYRYCCILLGILRKRSLDKLQKGEFRKMRGIFESLVANSSPPSLDGYMTFSDANVERQERNRLRDIAELRQSVQRGGRAFQANIGAIVAIAELSENFRVCPCDLPFLKKMQILLRGLNEMLG